MASTGPRRNVDIRSNVAAAQQPAETVASPIKQSKTVQHEYDPSKQSDEVSSEEEPIVIGGIASTTKHIPELISALQQKKAKQELKRRFDQEKAQAAEKKRIELEEQERKKQIKQQMSSDRTSQQTIDAARERAAERESKRQKPLPGPGKHIQLIGPEQAFGFGVVTGVVGTLAFNRLLGGLAKSVAPAAVAPVAEAILE